MDPASILAGLDWRDVVDITSFYTDLKTQRDMMAKVKARYITPRFPALTAIGVSRLVTDRCLAEIKIVARASVAVRGIAEPKAGKPPLTGASPERP